MIKKLSSVLLTALHFHAFSSVSLEQLIDLEKTDCLEMLLKANEQEIWSVFLEKQAELSFKADVPWIEAADWWRNSRSILEIGSGNGAYLHQLAQITKTKSFLGIEKNEAFVVLANEKYDNEQMAFQVGDAEIFDKTLSGTQDLILFRHTLQHLQKPYTALENAWHYLAPNGYVLLMDACDKATCTSHPVDTFNATLNLLEERNKQMLNLNRKISLDLFNKVTTSEEHFYNLFEVVFSNLDTSGQIIYQTPYFLGEAERKQFFNHALLFLTLIHRFYNIPVDLGKAYDELKDYTNDENAWTTIGIHFLVLKKI